MLAEPGKCAVPTGAPAGSNFSYSQREAFLGWRRPLDAAMHKVMARTLTALLLGLAACAWVNFDAVAASEPCKDCNADTGLTVREQIKADRAREVDRIAKESTDRPWDGKDYGRTKPLPSSPVIR